MKNKCVISFLLMFVLFFGSISEVAAREENTSRMLIVSETRTIDVGTSVEIELYEAIDTVGTRSISTMSTEGPVSKTASGKFKIVSSGQTVAVYDLSATFWYTGATVTIIDSDTYADPIPGWLVVHGPPFEYLISTTLARVTGVFVLKEYIDGQGYVYNNSSTIRIYCDEMGQITYTFE